MNYLLKYPKQLVIAVELKNKFLTELLVNSSLNERQLKAISFVKANNKISNSDYKSLNNTSDRTALRDLEELVKSGYFIKIGEKKGTYYKLNFGE
jgi:ATP-dependent DNA helicase RecG